MSKYTILVNILDKIIRDAPLEFARYRSSRVNIESLNQIRSRAYIHLFLLVRFGITDFRERERLITDGSRDGGVDAYFIDQTNKKIIFVQSKFRTNQNNFQEKEMELSEILDMHIDRIAEGFETSEDGYEYNGKIKGLIRDIRNIPDSGRYKYEVYILANLKGVSQSQLKKITGGFSCTVFDHSRTYQELVFPVVQGTYYNNEDLTLYISLSNKENPSITYEVQTLYGNCDVTVLFVPTIEIAKALSKYRNSILKYNPRSYLELNQNEVNKEIAETIKSNNVNEFALYNNGITILSSKTDVNVRIGQQRKAQLIIKHPQIINGGQTAFTLSRIYDDNEDVNPENIFKNKEVLVKVITIHDENTENYNRLIENISKSTNRQTSVDEADRRSNDEIQILVQDEIFKKYGYLYERKKGEFADGIRNGYISKDQIVNRELFIRLCKCCDSKPSEARGMNSKSLFSEHNFSSTLNDISRCDEYMTAYNIYIELQKIAKDKQKDKADKYGFIEYGYAIRYAKFAVITGCMTVFASVESESFQMYKKILSIVLDKWIDFEQSVPLTIRNNSYINAIRGENGKIMKQFDYDGYYKGQTVSIDVIEYFQKIVDANTIDILKGDISRDL